VCLHAPSIRAVVAAIAYSLARTVRVDSFHLCRPGCEDTKSESERVRERESERAREREGEQERESERASKKEREKPFCGVCGHSSQNSLEKWIICIKSSFY